MNQSARRPIESFAPGEFIRDELEARGWTQEVFAEILGKTPRLVSEVITGRRSITPETAHALADAFGTSPELWMNLDSAYKLSKVKVPDSDAIARRAKLYSFAPVKELSKRRWIEGSESIDVLEQRVFDFLGVSSTEEKPKIFLHAARKSSSYDTLTMAQCAWLLRARQLAKGVSTLSFSHAKLRDALTQIHTLLRVPEDARHVPRILAEAGIRFVIVEHLAQTRLDGAAFWLDSRSPVIVLTLRFDRIDYFWHTFIHDLMHLVNKDVGPKDVPLVDLELVGEKSTPQSELPTMEQRANRDAAVFLLPQSELDDFIVRVRPLYSKKRIRGFADQHGVHPGIVVGQLQHRGEIPWTHSRDLLDRVRNIVTAASLTDGWGYSAASDL